MREVRGWLIPEPIDVPEENWYRLEFGSTVMWDIDREGHEFMARQQGCTSICSSVVESGNVEGVIHAAVECEIEMPSGNTYQAVSGADAASQQVRDPEHVWSVAESRAVKRVVKRALGIRSADVSRNDADAVSASTGDDTQESSDSGGAAGGDIPAYPDSDSSTGDVDW